MRKRMFGAAGLVCVILLQLSRMVIPASAAQTEFTPAWPLREGFNVISLDYYPSNSTTKHGGIDVIGGSSTQYVYPVANGTVIDCGNDCPHYGKANNRHDNENCPGKLNGNYVILRHNVGGKVYYSKYLHLTQNSIPAEIIKEFKEGKTVTVTTDKPLGRMGSSGDSVGAHLHFSIYTGTYSKEKGQKTFDYYMNDASLIQKIKIKAGLANTSQRYGAWIKANGKLSGSYYVFTDEPKSPLQTEVTATSTVEGQWTVTVPANYKLLCYSSSTATSNSTYISAKSEAYRIACTKKATLSNGTTRYFFVSGDNKSVWFDFTSSMTVTTPTSASTYTITFNANGGSVSTSPKTVTNGSTYGTLPTPTRSNYTFDGWYTAQSGGSKVTASTSVNLTGNQTLYAHWSIINNTPTTSTTEGQWIVMVPANYKLLCYSSSTAISSSTYVSAKSSAYSLICTKKATLSNGTTRYFFVSGDNKSLWFDFTSNMTVSPSTTSYTISFNANGGSVSTSSKTVTNGLTYGTLPTPTRSNYTFDGWYTAQSGGSKITASTSVNLTGNQTLYAHWSGSTTKQPDPDSTLAINLTDYPTSITKGNIFSLGGDITSNYNITTVRGYIIDSSNKTVQSTRDTPNAKSMDIRPANLNQSLLFDKLSEGSYLLRIEATDASGKTLVSSKSFTVKSASTSNQTTNVSGQTIADGVYVIATKLDTNYVLDIDGASEDDGANVQLWEKNGTAAQTFKVTYIGSGCYQIVNTNSGKAIAIQNDSIVSGSNVCQSPVEINNAQLWKIESAGNGSYYIFGRGSLLYLDVDNANADSGTNVKAFYRNDAYDAQKWVFYKQ